MDNLKMLATVMHQQGKFFSDQLEQELVDHCIKAFMIFHGLTTQDIRHLAYEYGEANNVKLPESWTANKAAWTDWKHSWAGTQNCHYAHREPHPFKEWHASTDQM